MPTVLSCDTPWTFVPWADRARQVAHAMAGQGYATDAVRALVRLAREVPEIERIVGHTPLDRPASGRVLAKLRFTLVGETDDEHEGATVRVHRWELAL